ncbi:DMT family transporter [Chromohalobacter israelensis]|uniref:DMT family transporter n=1 Tax=Chromohalobacter israelensis TaxID=141390 RepID=UPI00068B8C4F|nr:MULTISPECIES: SMR family transporter [Chromohalobacter]MDF9435002.1 SMR family transporter [Chromohalobacter israelensis]PWW42900.1 paired small multidrug resistance pump [Chromohalobacter salexigens]
MTMRWLILPLAALAEVGWATGLKLASSPLEWLATVIVAAMSLLLAVRAVRFLPASTVYTVFVGLGAAGTVVADAWLFGTRFSWPSLACIGVILVGVIGLHQFSGKPAAPASVSRTDASREGVSS